MVTSPDNRQPEYTKIQSPNSKTYKTVAIPQSVSRILDIKKGSHALWTPLPIRLGDEVKRLIVFTSVDNPHDLDDEYKRIISLFED